MASFGNSFGEKRYNPVGAERINIWDSIEERYPSGAYLAVSSTHEEGSVIPAGTPVTIASVGATPVLNGTSPTGLLEEDVVMGSKGCTLSVVTRGRLCESRSKATITAAQKTALAGRILFVAE